MNHVVPFWILELFSKKNGPGICHLMRALMPDRIKDFIYAMVQPCKQYMHVKLKGAFHIDMDVSRFYFRYTSLILQSDPNLHHIIFLAN